MYGRFAYGRTAYAVFWVLKASVGGSFQAAWCVGVNLPVIGTGTY